MDQTDKVFTEYWDKNKTVFLSLGVSESAARTIFFSGMFEASKLLISVVDTGISKLEPLVIDKIFN